MSPLPVTWRGAVRSEWVDRNDHLNVGYYMVVFDEATTRFFDYCGLDDAHRARYHVATFTLESHATYERELLLAAPLRITTQLLAWSERKVHYFHRLYHDDEGYLAATNELLSLQVDRRTRRATPFADEIRTRFAEIRAGQDGIAHPARAGRVIDVAAKAPPAEEEPA